MKNHPAAEAFPMMDEKRFAELREDIRANGQAVPIVTCDGMILDGLIHKNRKRSGLEEVDESGVQDRCRKWVTWVESQPDLEAA